MKCILQDEEMSLIKKVELEWSKISWVSSLAQWVPWYWVPEPIQEFVMEKIRKWETNRYSIVPWIPELRQQVALRYYKNNSVEVDFENEIVITAWAIQAISSVLLTILEKDEEVMLLDPCYASYDWCIKLSRWNPVYSSLDENLDIDVQDVLSKINSKTKAIIISNPNNPTWSIFTIEKIKQILDAIDWKDIYLILDEVYDEFLYDGNFFESGINLYKKYKKNLILVNSWSKTFGMTWRRVWYFLADSNITKEVLKVHDWLVTCAPVHSQWAALASFEIYDRWIWKVRKELQKRRDYTIQEMNKLSSYIEFWTPKAAYFLFPRFKYTEKDYEECLKILHESKVALVPWSGFWNRGRGHFRICFWRDFDDLSSWIEKLGKYFNK